MKAIFCPDPWFGIGAMVYGYLLILFTRVDSRFFESTPRVSRPSRRAFRSALRALVECNLRREGKEDPWSTGTSAIVHADGFEVFESTPRVYGGFLSTYPEDPEAEELSEEKENLYVSSFTLRLLRPMWAFILKQNTWHFFNCWDN